jgi:hypothetical protein
LTKKNVEFIISFSIWDYGSWMDDFGFERALTTKAQRGEGIY